MESIRISLDSPGRRNQLRELLEDEYRLVSTADRSDTDAEDESRVADLFILDLASFRSLGVDGIEWYKAQEPNLASPVLLLAPSSRLSQLDPVVWNHVDDVIGTPFERTELEGRVRALLRMRRYSEQAETARKRASTKYRALFDSSAHGIFLFSEGEIVEANARAGELFGVSSETLIGRPVSWLAGDEQWGYEAADETLGELVRQTHERGEASMEWRFDPPEADSFWADFTLSRVRYGEEELVQALLRDVTPRHEARRELEASQDLLARAQEVAGVGGWEYDPETDRVVGTSQLAKILGRGETVDFDLDQGLSYYTPEGRSRLEEAVQRGIEEGEPFDVEVRFETETGAQRWGRVRGQVRTEEGTVARLVGTLQDVTERKEAERELRRRREQLKTAQRLAKLGSWDRDLEADELRWSDQTLRIFGWPEEKTPTYEEFMDAVHPDDREALRNQQEKAIGEGEAIDVEYRIVRPDGDVRIVRERGEAELGADGDIVGLIGALLDVTEQRRREKEINRLRKKYEGLLQGAPDAIFVAEADTGTIVEANAAAASLLDAPVDAIVGRHQSELHPEGEAEKYRELFRRHQQQADLKSATLSRHEDGSQIFAVSDSGERVPVEINATLVDLEAEQYFVGSFRDISRRRAEEERRRLFEQAVEQTGDMIFITGSDGTIQYANPATERITGYKRNAIVGEKPSLFRSGETSQAAYDELWDTVRSGGVYRNSFTNRRKDGTLVEIDETITPLEDESGEIAYFVSTGRDITERVERERKLREREKALQEERDRFVTLFEHLPTPVLRAEKSEGEDGPIQISNANAAFEETFGLATQEIRGKSVPEVLVPPDRLAEHEEIADQVLRQSELETEVVRRTADGPRRFRLRVSTREPDAGPVELYATYSDITEEYNLRERRRRQREAVVRLTTDDAISSGDFETAVGRITEVSANVLNVSRAKIWLVDHQDFVLRCRNQFDRGDGRHDSGAELDLEAHPRYFEALASHSVIDAENARSDFRLGELAGGYLEPNGVQSRLDATLRSEGKVVGVVSFEQVGQPRGWARDEIQFAEQVADIVFRALRNRDRAERREQIAFQESLLKAQQEAVLDGMLALNEEGDVISYNDRFLEVWDIPESIVQNGSRQALLDWASEHLADPTVFAEDVGSQTDPAESVRDEVELADGRVLEQYSAPLEGRYGTAYGRLWTYRDITERKAREAVMLRRRDRVEALYAAAGQIFQADDRLDVAGRIEELLSETFGYPFTAVRFARDGQLVPVRMTPNSPTYFPDRGARSVSGDSLGARAYRSGETLFREDLDAVDNDFDYGELESGVCIPIGRHGVIDLASPRAGAIESFDLQLVEILAAHASVVLDGIEQLRALRESEERFRGVFENAAVGIGIIDDDGIIIDANPTLQNLTGYAEEELEGSHFGFITHPDDIDEDQRLYQELIDGERYYYQLEKRYVRKDGEVFWGRLTVSRHDGDAEGQVVGMVEDIDDQKRYERELLEAKEEAEEASRLKSAMLANMSHEVRTPLTSIIGFSEVLKNRLDGEMATFADKAYDSSQRLMNTLDSVLELSRLEAESYNFDRETVHLDEVVLQTVDMLRPTAEEMSVSLEANVPDTPVVGSWNEGALNRILGNLVENAIKFTEASGQVQVSVAETEEHAVLEIEDTGIGIAGDDYTHVFEPFKQESQGLDREYEGSGLGLAIVKELTEALGGTIAVESEKGEGTTFTVRLPFD